MLQDVWKSYDANELTHSAAHHLMAVHELRTRHGYARVSDVAKYLKITKGSVSSAMKHLKERGYETPRVLEAHYGDNPGKQGQEMYALQSGPVEASFEYMVSEDTIALLRSMKERRDQDGGRRNAHIQRARGASVRVRHRAGYCIGVATTCPRV